MQGNLQNPSDVAEQVVEENSSSGDEEDLIAKLQSSGMPTKRYDAFIYTKLYYFKLNIIFNLIFPYMNEYYHENIFCMLRDTAAVKSHNSGGHKKSRLPIVQSKPVPSNNTHFSSSNSYGQQYHQYTSTNIATGEIRSSSNGQNQLFTRRNLFQPQGQQFGSQWTATPASEDGEVESQGQESVKKFCTEDTPISLSKAGSNTNISSLTFDDDDNSTPGNIKYDAHPTGGSIKLL